MSAPTAEQVTQAFPKSAIGKVAAAHVVMRCAFLDDGALSGCESVSATGGHAFVEAAEALTRDFRAYVNPKKDKLSDLRIDIPFDFRDPSQASPPIDVLDPLWLRRINPQAAVKLFPPKAADAGVRSGGADVECTVQHDGALTACIVVSEDPPHLGFGEAALAVAGVMAMNPWTAQGTSVDGARIRLPVRLSLPADTPPGAAVAPAKP